MYKKLLSVTLLSIFLLTFAFATVFAQIEGPKEGCEISQDLAAGKWRIQGDSITIAPAITIPADISPTGAEITIPAGTYSGRALFRDNNNDGLFTFPAEMIPGTSLASMIMVPGFGQGPLSSLSIPQTALRDGTGDWVDIKTGDTLPSNWAVFCLLNTIDTVIDWIFTFLIVVSVALIAIAGFMWMTAGAAPERQKKAGGMIMAAVIGIAIALLAKVIPAVITGILL